LDALGWRWAESAEAADFAVVLESGYFKTRDYVGALRGEAEIARWPEKCFTLNGDDGPLPLLPGVYTAMPRRHFDAGRMVAGCYIQGSPNPWCEEFAARRGEEPEWLYSFRGAESSPVRARMLAGRSELEAGGEGRVTRSAGWFDHSPEAQREYLEEIVRSRFVICPRGQGTASHRLFEVMQLGRVPVILADAWVPPPGIDWGRCAIRLPERRWREIPEVVRGVARDWPALAEAARRAWEERFAPESRLRVMLEGIADLRAGVASGEAAARRRWERMSGANLGGPWERLGRAWRRWAGGGR
jgi:hypothetical protein